MIVLGSTGSIGRNSLELARKFGIKVEALSCNKNYKLLNAQIAEFRPKFVCIGDENLKNLITHDKVFCGADGILEMLENCESKFVINALVGFAGLVPSVTALEENKILCLANKESLVVGGKLIRKLLASGKGKLWPIDSEHVAIAKLLSCINRDDLSRILITASGGSFRLKKRED
ncbi:MAG: 1-deoxy-D-xylulose-5-phosphate reductoisomerase, partial [Campylobacter sp.]|nr:1-deoxy-D-xylulose-5-phosphate reductoisomerase [Campylobacter sp.]